MAKEKDLSEIFISRMIASSPKKEARKDGTRNGSLRIILSDEEILGDIRYVLKTGIEPFDAFTGGFPFGRISEVFGLENCGKTALMVRSMCRFCAKHIYQVVGHKGFDYELERIDPKKVRLIKCYVDNEHSIVRNIKLSITDTTFDAEGKALSERTYWEGVPVEEADTIEMVFMSLEKFLTVIREAETAIQKTAEDKGEEPDTLIFGLFIVDTVAGTSSKDEINRDWGEKDFPRAAGKISEGFRRLTNEVSRHNVAAIFTNQVRTKFNDLQRGSGYKASFGTPQESDFSTYGGRALSYYATHRVFMFRLPIKYTLIKGEQFSAGHLIGFRTHKNRLRMPMREARIVLLFDEEQGGLHNLLSLLESLVFLGAAEMRDDHSFTFLFRQFRLETTTFAENINFAEPEEEKEMKRGSRRKKVENPEIDGRYQWLGFYRAHRADLDKLWEAAVKRANTIRGLRENDEPMEESSTSSDPYSGEDQDNEPPVPAHKRKPKSVPGIADEDL
jgi:RecA/RadA recombinase